MRALSLTASWKRRFRVKFYSARLELDGKLETKIPNLFACGDGAGITRGLSQASASGVHVARQIGERAKLGK